MLFTCYLVNALSIIQHFINTTKMLFIKKTNMHIKNTKKIQTHKIHAHIGIQFIDLSVNAENSTQVSNSNLSIILI